jgi:arginyl-tRNA synthetase
VGHGRNAVLGDTIANILEWVGYDVTREYYFNNAGRQMKILADSVRLRYLELLGEKIDYPEDYYQGDYIKDIAKMLIDEYGDKL